MAGRALTAAFLDGLAPPAAGRLEIVDLRCGGLSFRITATGVRSWCFRFRDPESGKSSRATLGNYPAVPLKSARTRAEAMRRDIASGINPVASKRIRRATAKDRTFGALATRYMTEHAERHKRPASAKGDRLNLERHILPVWKDRPYATIRRADAIEIIEGLITAGKPIMANRIHSLLSTIFSFAVDADLLDVNPLARLKKRGVETAGERVLSDDELRLFWMGIVQPPSAHRTGLALRLALLTGARRSEVAGMTRGELAELAKPAAAQWTIPAERSKNGRAHILPLAPLALGIVAELIAGLPADEQCLFPTMADRAGSMPGTTLSRAMQNFARRLGRDTTSAADPATTSWLANPPSPHDLRRTLETRLAALGIAKDIRDRVLNHAPATADTGARHYDRHSYMPEKRAALFRWNDVLTTLLEMPKEGAEILPLARGSIR